MSIIMQINPFDFFTDSHGDALDAGFIYIGEPNKDPRQYPVAAFYDVALTIPAAMPLRTSNGYIVRSGSPTFLYIDGNYSILVQDKNHRQIYYVADFLMIGSGQAASKADLANAIDPAKGAGMIGYRGITVRAALDSDIDVRAMGAVGNGLAGSGAANLAALNAAVAAFGSGVYRFRWSPNGDNTFILSDSWNIVDLDNVMVYIDPGVIVKTIAATTFGHVICFGAGTPLGGTRTDRVRNVGFAGGGQVISSGSAGADNGMGFLRAADWFVIGMDIPTCDRKPITCQVNDPTGDPNKFNGNGWVLNCKIGTCGNHGISIEGGCDGTVFVDGNTGESIGGDGIHFSGSVSPDVSIARAILGTNVFKACAGKGLFAFKVLDLVDQGFICSLSAERGVDISTCGSVALKSKTRSSGSWGARISSCTGDLFLSDGFTCSTAAASFTSLDLSNNTKDVLISAAFIGSGTGTHAMSATGKSAILAGASFTSGATGMFNGVFPQGRLVADGVYSEVMSSIVHKVPGASVLFANGDTTPDVSESLVFKTQNTGATSITNFDGGYDGQRITIVFNDVLTTIVDGAPIRLAGSVNYTPTAGNDTLSLVRAFGGWFETGRSDN